MTNTTANDAFDPVVIDTIDAGATIDSNFTTDGLDNDGDGTIDEADEATQITVVGQTITFRPTTDVIGSGNVIYQYQVTIDNTVIPGQVIDNTAEVFWSSLPNSLDGDVTGTATERTGSDDNGGALHDYNSVPSTTSISVPDLTFTKTPDTIREQFVGDLVTYTMTCLLYTSPSPRDATLSRMPSSA